ncbi:MAG TPA: regulatory protein RecX [Vicinamibacterales bacterium]|nr:regulatory protein RecX [Vicinamibacterales bacterium]
MSPPPHNRRGSAYSDALALLSRRDLSVSECRARLRDREHPAEDIDAAIERLRESGALDDARVARSYAQTALSVKGRGRLRILRELQERGISKEDAAGALGDVAGSSDERALVTKAIQKRLRTGRRPTDRAGFARLYQYLMRQGFTPSAVSAELRKLRGGGSDDDL